MTLAAHRRVSNRSFLKTWSGAWLLKACPLRLITHRKHTAERPTRTERVEKKFIIVYLFLVFVFVFSFVFFDNAYYF